jgi:protein-S-isoprenylcysteine O-methyltransferase Ste14
MSKLAAMFARALLAFIALPGIVAFAIPIIIVANSGMTSAVRLPGIVVSACGLTALLWCVWAFYSNGKGTLAPWCPPTRMVTVGLYRFSRNPMYLAVLLVLVGWALSLASLSLGVYAVLVALAFHLRVVLGEEPWLARTHGAQWQVYEQSVPRWLGLRYKPATMRDG